MKVRAIFTDNGYTWTEVGELRLAERTKGMFVIDTDDGNRVFPMRNRDVEVYNEDPYDPDPILQTKDDRVLVNRTSLKV